MKVIHVFAMVGLVAFLGCQRPPNNEAKKEVVSATIETKSIKCEVCVKTITKTLEKVDGVKSVEVDLQKKVVNVDYNPQRVGLSVLETAIAEAGYDADATKRNDAAYQQLPECCR